MSAPCLFSPPSADNEQHGIFREGENRIFIVPFASSLNENNGSSVVCFFHKNLIYLITMNVTRPTRCKTLLSILMLLGIVIISSAWTVCLDGCIFSYDVCGNGFCGGETLNQHLNKRTQSLNITVGFQLLSILGTILILFFVIQRYLERERFTSASYIRQKFLNSPESKLFNYLIEAFSRGLIHPQIY